jgi:hypothetical protein
MLTAEAPRDMAVVLLQLMKATSCLIYEDSLPGDAAALLELQALAAQCVSRRVYSNFQDPGSRPGACLFQTKIYRYVN